MLEWSSPWIYRFTLDKLLRFSSLSPEKVKSLKPEFNREMSEFDWFAKGKLFDSKCKNIYGKIFFFIILQYSELFKVAHNLWVIYSQKSATFGVTMYFNHIVHL